ncbi:hypothetical protein [Agathobaculum sp. Marseille-P7918]|uniref:hypothetical protein n=1 Tax=Agathobaculum sp. Marseille-P7918 TaxID=2479843 RepID=UPI0013DE6C8D|nr:hypothetical protein [Agathobaculum sp. Marseille-P7918]
MLCQNETGVFTDRIGISRCRFGALPLGRGQARMFHVCCKTTENIYCEEADWRG